MEDLRKVSSMQLYLFWKNLSIGLLTVIAMFSFSKLLPFYLSPVVSLICAAVLYTLLYNNKMQRQTSCMMVPYAIFFCLINYTFVTIVINVLSAWGFIVVPPEIIFFNRPYIPSLVMNPICFITLIVIYFRRHSLRLCVNCRLFNGTAYERGALGTLLSSESHFQLKNLIVLFGVLSAMIWSYYILVYVNINVSARDWYVFTWLTIIAFVIDEVYFLFRYYNLYLDLKEHNEIITPQELADMTAKTYLRFYVICENSIFVNAHTIDPKAPHREVIDTPFFTKRSVNGITLDEVRRIIRRMTGTDGELRFFYGRKSPDMSKHSLLRYFYFLDGKTSDHDDIPVEGEWMDFDKIKTIYTKNAGRLSQISVADITRLATIILTEKIFDDRGMRKSKIRTYSPTFSLEDVRNSELDFQDDKWIRISMFNSDTRLYRFKRWWRGVSGKSNNRNQWR